MTQARDLQEKAATWFAEKGLMTQYALSDKYLGSKHPTNITIGDVVFMYRAEHPEDDTLTIYAGVKFTIPSDEFLNGIYCIESNDDNTFKVDFGNNQIMTLSEKLIQGFFKKGDWVVEIEQPDSAEEEIILLPNPMREKALTAYIRELHNQDECCGFTDGYEQSQEDLQPLVDSHTELLEACNSVCKLYAGLEIYHYINEETALVLIKAKSAIDKAKAIK